VIVLGDAIEYVKIPKKIFDPISDMVKAGIYKDEQEALQHLVHDQAEQKIEHYGKKIAEMEQKYGMDFSAFEKKIHSRIDEENFEEWDDFIFWESYVKAYRYWEQFL
jgi:Arc/MetJ-type ribon-helix-helix transcriptional regulator